MIRFRVIHTAVLKPETNPWDFEEFMLGSFLAATKALPGCIDAQLLKGYRGYLPGVANAKVDYAWITLWENVDANDEVWAPEGEHRTPDALRQPMAKLQTLTATVTLVGGFTVVTGD